MTVADVIRMLLEMDQQMISPRPSVLGRAAELVAMLAEHAGPSLRRPDVMGDWESIDLSPARGRAPRDLDQTTMTLAEENDRLRGRSRDVAPAALVLQPGGIWTLFDDHVDASIFRQRLTREGYPFDTWHAHEWAWREPSAGQRET